MEIKPHIFFLFTFKCSRSPIFVKIEEMYRGSPPPNNKKISHLHVSKPKIAIVRSVVVKTTGKWGTSCISGCMVIPNLVISLVPYPQPKKKCFMTIRPMDYGRLKRKSPSLHGPKSNPNSKFIGMAEAYFVFHISPKFQVSLIYTFIGCPQSVIIPIKVRNLPNRLKWFRHL